MNQQHFNAVFNRLTERRREVLLKLLVNEKDEAIAKSLQIEKVTVRKYREKICKLFGLNNEFPDERRSKLPELIALFAKYKPELLNRNISELPQTENFSEDKTISKNPDFVGRKEAIANSIPENHLAELIRILQGMQQQDQKPISSANLISIPPTLENWQGRNTEIKELQTWLVDTKVKTIGIQGLSGVGKSWLASYMFESTYFEAKFWADVRQGTDFTVFAQNALMKLAGTSSEQLAALREPEQLIFALLDSLKQRSCLLVIDNLETLLDQDRHLIGVYRDFFNRWIEHGGGSKLLLTTQTQPEVMEGHGYWLDLQGLEASDGAKLLQELEIVGSHEELQDFSRYLNGHPKMLRLVASKLKLGTHIREADKLGFRQLELLLNQVPMPYRDREKVFFVWILQQHFENLTPELQAFFLNLSLYRRSFDRNAAAVVLPDTKPLVDLISWDRLRETPPQEKELENLKSFDTVKITNLGMVVMNSEGHQVQDPAIDWKTQQALDELKNRSLLDMSQEDYRYQFHPFVLQYARQKAGKQEEDLRERLIGYYLSIGSDRTTWETLEDVAPHLEIVYHLCKMKKYAVAFDTLRIYKEVLDLRGYYSVQLELYEQLVQLWKPSETETWEYAASLIDLGTIYSYLGQYPQAIQTFEKALVLERKIANRQGEAAALGNLGIIYQDIGQYQTSLEHYDQQLAIAREISDHQEEARALNNLGTLCYWMGQYQKAIDYQEQKIKVLQNNGDDRQKAITLGNLGSAYCALGQYQTAIDYHNKQLKIAREIGYRPIEARALDALGVAHNCLEQYQQAIELFQQALVIAQEIGERAVEAISATNLGNTYFFLGQQQHRQAIEYYQQSIKIAQKIGHYRAQANAWFNYGNVLAALQEKPQAINAYQNARTLCQAMGLDEYVQQANEAIERSS